MNADAVEAARRIVAGINKANEFYQTPIAWFINGGDIALVARAYLDLLSRDAGWEPIETAPKDGTPILVARHNRAFGWVRGWATWVDVRGISGWISHGFFEVPGALGLADPTHWRTLPSHPLTRKEPKK